MSLRQEISIEMKRIYGFIFTSYKSSDETKKRKKNFKKFKKFVSFFNVDGASAECALAIAAVRRLFFYFLEI